MPGCRWMHGWMAPRAGRQASHAVQQHPYHAIRMRSAGQTCGLASALLRWWTACASLVVRRGRMREMFPLALLLVALLVPHQATSSPVDRGYEGNSVGDELKPFFDRLNAARRSVKVEPFAGSEISHQTSGKGRHNATKYFFKKYDGQLPHSLRDTESFDRQGGPEVSAAKSGSRKLLSESTVRRKVKRHQQRSRFNECWSRGEQKHYLLDAGRPSRKLAKLLIAYAERHRTCTAGVQNWTALILGEEQPPLAGASFSFSQRSNGSDEFRRSHQWGPRCQFLLYQYSTPGLGNRIQGLVSSFAYALLTGRALLVGDWSLAAMLCKPFPGSQWFLPWNVYDLAQNVSRDAVLTNFTRKAQTTIFETDESTLTRAWFDLSYQWTPKDHNFFCDHIQLQIRRVMWLTINTEQYFLPGLFVIPMFRAILEELFPDRAPFTHLARHLLHPVNYIWERITRIYALHFQSSKKSIGVQVRTFATNDSYAFDRIHTCLWNISQAAPAAISPAKWRDQLLWGNGFEDDANDVGRVVEQNSPQRITLFITSLHGGTAAHFRSLYTDGAAVDGSLVDVYAYSNEENQREDFNQDQRALTEMFLLSFCDNLLATHFSTFGYIAAGLSGRPPYLMNIISKGASTFAIPYEKNGRPVCELSRSAEPCSIFPPHKRQCLAGGGYPGAREAPYLLPCLDEQHGVRIVPGEQAGAAGSSG